MDIEEQLVEILDKYNNLCKSQAEMRREMYYLVQSLFVQMASNRKRVAIRCDGQYMYFLLKEFSHLLSIDYVNVIGKSEYKERIDYFRNKLKREKSGFIDIDSNPKFKYSKLLYENLKKPRVV